MSRQPTVEWQVCGTCNYDCSYCIQSRKYRVGHPSEAEIDRFLEFYAGLPGGWEIKMTGGEPFAFRGFLARIVPGLVERTPHRVSVLTNLSAPVTALDRFAELTRGRLEIVSASLHLEQVDVVDFRDKALRLRERIDARARLIVNAVLVPGRLEAVERAKELLEAVGLRLYPQVMKTKHGVSAYGGADTQRLLQLLGPAPTSRTANVAPSHHGRACWAGAEYLVVTQAGDAWRCRTARRAGEGHLGNVLEGTARLAGGPSPCPYTICPCAVPENRGMIEGRPA
ncbi:MAG: radical SAM protein [Polyangiaceae bacterium]|nr:radical SAM protein [Polyangiaceae bacterium]